MGELLALAERCEKATGPDRELDGLIFKALERRERDMWTTFGDDNVWHRRDPQDHAAFDPPLSYTKSIEAAKTLLLDWMSIEMTESAPEPQFTRCRIWDWRRSPAGFDPGNEWKAERQPPVAAQHLRRRSPCSCQLGGEMSEKIFYQSHQCEGYRAKVTIEWLTPEDVEADLLPASRMQNAEAIAESILAFSGTKMRDMVRAMRAYSPPRSGNE